MVSAGWATLDVIPSVKGIARELDKQTSGPMAAAGRSGGKRFGDAAGAEASKGFRSRFSNAVKGFNPLAGLAIGAGVVAGFVDIKNEASAAEQAVGGVQAVFGKYADGVISDSERAAQGLGLSATAYQELITLSGALLKNKGVEDFAGQARTLVKVGADLAAQFGGSTQEAVEALNSAMRGESDPIERYAISLNETAIKAELARKGMSGLEGAALDQAKTQARLSLIMQQSADAAGAFGREAETAAGKEARATAQLADMRKELGEKLLPAYAGFVGFLNDEGLPALEAAGGFAMDAGRAFADLPAPIKATAGAFVALKIASATGLTGGLAAGARRTSSAIDTLRLRTMLAADAYRDARTVTRSFGDSTVAVSSGVGRMSASMSAAKTATSGLGGAMKTSLSGAMGLLGGPWGIALIAATGLVTKFWAEHKEAEAHVDDLSSTLNKQTGAITENTRAAVVNALEKEGVLETARGLGLSLDTVTDAAMGNTRALEAIKDAQDAAGASGADWGKGNNALIGSFSAVIKAVSNETGAIAEARSEHERTRDAMGATSAAADRLAKASGRSSGEFVTYASKIAEVRGELQKLIAAERERASAAIQNRRDQIALIETQKAAAAEARTGARTLNRNTEAGRANWNALLDLADQWVTSTPKVQNARGAYEQMRAKFIQVAREMGATKKRARELADELLNIPKKAPIEFQSKGYQARMAEIERIKNAMWDLGSVGIDYTPRGFGSPPPRANGGPVSPRSPYLVGERGPEIFRPTGAGSIVPNHKVATGGGAGVQVNIDTVVAHDYRDFMGQAQRRVQRAGLDGVRSGR